MKNQTEIKGINQEEVRSIGYDLAQSHFEKQALLRCIEGTIDDLYFASCELRKGGDQRLMDVITILNIIERNERRDLEKINQLNELETII